MTQITDLQIGIRAAIATDLPEIVEIYNDAIPGRMATADLEPVNISSRQQWFHDRDHQKCPIWVAVDQAEQGDHRLISDPDLNHIQNIQNTGAPDPDHDQAIAPTPDYRLPEPSPKPIMGWLSVQNFYGRCAYQGTMEVSIYVANRHQGKGVGKQLLSYAIATGPQIGITCLMGMIFGHNQPSLQLFSKFGFEQWGHLPQIARLDGVKRDLVIVGLHLPNPESR
ncbi:GCN5-related N-acetyltransferase [Thalassoporum mexicanum PCC 7367]|uniref:GNAT family N-acetyltransferase n=1 Tax=Thalassoporum mexicanum TaxID=3457544 RepID=UPI00029FA639|nr:GNAT family N-acetyltransferase [Pseudanabaena sp. PCC 7367]AFY68949.1 GCN5-related N-acetyltransferase [Pseudanabaena sp. PCC 7367]